MTDNAIKNDPTLLDEMMADLRGYDGPLGPGPYWADNQRATLDWLRTNDLNGFRQFEPAGKALTNFGGGSWWPYQDAVQDDIARLSAAPLYRIFQKLRFSAGTRTYARSIKRHADALRLRNSYAIHLESLCRTRDRDGELDRIEASPCGRPTDLLEMGGRLYTPNFLISFLRYLDMKEMVDFDRVDSYVEIGPGAGLFVEVLAKLKPRLRIYLVDIPPQLYVLQQVLQSIFGDEVATYRDIKNNPGLLKSGSKRIFILPPWQIDLIGDGPVGLAHNSGFGEMRKDTVETYLDYFRKWRAQYIYICALDFKKTLLSIKTDDYAGLLPEYELLERRQTRSGQSLGPVSSSGTKVEIRPASDVCFGLKESDGARR